MGSIRPVDLNIRHLSLAFRQRYWTRHADEPDASILWPGIRQQIGQWIAGELPLVTAALTTSGEPVVASRAIFSRSQTLHDLWYYGYFYTLPKYRRLGLGERVMRNGLAAIAKAGARNCSCYVAENNHASADLAIKLGFQKLPFVRVVFRDSQNASHTTRSQLAETTNVRLLAGAWTLINRIAGGKVGAAVITDEVTIPRPWQPWKSAESQLVYLKHENGEILGIGRIGLHKAIFLPDIDKLSSDPEGMIFSSASVLSRHKNFPVFTFLPRHIVDSLQNLKLTSKYEIYDVFWHADLQQNNY